MTRIYPGDTRVPTTTKAERYALITKEFPQQPSKVVARMLGMSVQGVEHIAYGLGLRKAHRR